MEGSGHGDPTPALKVPSCGRGVSPSEAGTQTQVGGVWRVRSDNACLLCSRKVAWQIPEAPAAPGGSLAFWKGANGRAVASGTVPKPPSRWAVVQGPRGGQWQRRSAWPQTLTVRVSAVSGCSWQEDGSCFLPRLDTLWLCFSRFRTGPSARWAGAAWFV